MPFVESFYLFSILNNTYAKIENIVIIFLLKSYFNSRISKIMIINSLKIYIIN
jgi:hypothetical protein